MALSNFVSLLYFLKFLCPHKCLVLDTSARADPLFSPALLTISGLYEDNPSTGPLSVSWATRFTATDKKQNKKQIILFLLLNILLLLSVLSIQSESLSTGQTEPSKILLSSSKTYQILSNFDQTLMECFCIDFYNYKV